jgi:hypothetical protein
VWVKLGCEDPTCVREDGSLWAGVIEKAGGGANRSIDLLRPRQAEAPPPIATVVRSFRRPCDAFEHPHALGG